MKGIKVMALILALSLLEGGLAMAELDFSASTEGIATGIVNARTAVHDPSIIAADGRYYIFGSHMMAAVSDNLRNWDRVAGGYSSSNRVWGDLFAEGGHVFDYAGGPESVIPTDDGGYHVWAPDVIYNKTTGQYMMYYCTSSTWNASNICFGVSETIEGPYTWEGSLVCSGFDKNTLSATDVLDWADETWVRRHHLTLAGTYNYKDYPNAIDPTVFYDKDDRLWMVYGSWSGGIFLLELDPATGLVIHPEADEKNGVDPYFGRKLLGGNHQSIEGPYIVYDEEADWYYLFVSYGGLNRTGGYQIRAFRSKEVEGPYLDMADAKPAKAGHALYGLKLSGNYDMPSVRTAYMATGHNSAMIDADGKRYLCYHSRFDNGTEGFLPIVKQYGLNKEGWPCLLPYATRGESLTAETLPEDVSGRYYVINQGMEIDDQIARPFILYLQPDGQVAGEQMSGSWSREDGTIYLQLTLGETEYSGILCRMQDEAGTEVTVFSAVGQNESLWGVRYD